MIEWSVLHQKISRLGEDDAILQKQTHFVTKKKQLSEDDAILQKQNVLKNQQNFCDWMMLISNAFS